MSSPSAIRVLIADDHTVVREGVRTLLSSDPTLEVVGDAADGAEAVEQTARLHPDVILMDLKMPRMSGLEAIQRIKAIDPRARILVLSSFDSDEMVFPAIKAGAVGYLLKDSSPEQLLQAVHDVHSGESWLHPAIAMRLMQELGRQSEDLPPTDAPLTARELDVLRLIARGMSNQAIGGELDISERTVSNHVGSILEKLQLANRTQAALYALREGLASLDDDG